MQIIRMCDMEFYGYTGFLSEEKENGQVFCVSCELRFDDILGAKTDRLEDTVDYSDVYDIVRDITENSSFNLIEHLAYVIGGTVLEKYSDIREITVTVSKPDAPIDGMFRTMETVITRKRDE